jgi:hypothetical protein
MEGTVRDGATHTRRWKARGWAGLLVVACLGVAGCAGRDGEPALPSAPEARRPAVSDETTSSAEPHPSGILVKPDPPTGRVPLTVIVNMCKSVEPPDGTSKYTVDWGDGETTRGSCRQTHVYERPGRFDAEACAAERAIDPPRSCRRFTVETNQAGGPDAVAPFAVRTRGAGVIAIAVPNFTQFASGPFLEGTPLTLADLQSATRIVFDVQMTVSDCPIAEFGLVNTAGGAFDVYLAGAPSLAGQTGAISYELTPGQFTTAVDSFVYRTGSGAAVPCNTGWSSIKVSLYR